MKSFLQITSILLIIWILNQPAQATQSTLFVQYYAEYMQVIDDALARMCPGQLNDKR